MLQNACFIWTTMFIWTPITLHPHKFVTYNEQQLKLWYPSVKSIQMLLGFWYKTNLHHREEKEDKSWFAVVQHKNKL